MGIDNYPNYYSAHWLTNKKASQFRSVVAELGAETYSPTYIALKSKEGLQPYTFSDLDKMKDLLDNECSFLRVESDRFTAIWSYEPAVQNFLVAFVSERRDPGRLLKLYEMTSPGPKASVLRPVVSDMTEKYLE